VIVLDAPKVKYLATDKRRTTLETTQNLTLQTANGDAPVLNHINRLHVRIVVSVTALVWCVALSASDGRGADVDRILKRYPGYHLLTLQERDPDVKAFVVRHFPKDNPSLVRADFNGDGNPDYALLLRDDKSSATKLVVLLCPADGPCKTVYEVNETANAGSVYLRPVSVGSKVSETEALNGNTQPMKLHSTGIRVTYDEKGEVVLYWNRKLEKIESVQTAD
jgi:hypothetical protein